LNVLNIKPVVPIKLNDEWNLINRAIIPLISQPGVAGASIGRKNGLGNIVRPTNGSDHNIQLTLQFMFPKGK